MHLAEWRLGEDKGPNTSSYWRPLKEIIANELLSGAAESCRVLATAIAHQILISPRLLDIRD